VDIGQASGQGRFLAFFRLPNWWGRTRRVGSDPRPLGRPRCRCGHWSSEWSTSVCGFWAPQSSYPGQPFNNKHVYLFIISKTQSTTSWNMRRHKYTGSGNTRQYAGTIQGKTVCTAAKRLCCNSLQRQFFIRQLFTSQVRGSSVIASSPVIFIEPCPANKKTVLNEKEVTNHQQHTNTPCKSRFKMSASVA
jgi:hypothetical protein